VKAGASAFTPLLLTKIEWLSLNNTDVGTLYCDNLNETFIDVYVTSNYLRPGVRHLAFPALVHVEDVVGIGP
jgi:hypothetical protein